MRWLKDDRGAALPVAVVLLSLLVAGLSVLWDWSRAQIHWRGLQTAADAAALAGAMEGERWARVRVDKQRRVCSTRTSPDGTQTRQCRTEHQTATLDGLEDELLRDDGRGQNGWRRRAGCAIGGNWKCTATVLGRWIEIDRARAERAARDAFNANLLTMDPLGAGGFSWRIAAIEVYDRHRGPAVVTDPNEDVVAVRA